MRRRVLIILPSYGIGGAERYALRVIEHAKAHDLEWHVTSVLSKHRELEGSFRELGAAVHHQSPGYAHPWQALRFFRFLRNYEFRAVMSLTGVFAGVALTLGRLAGVHTRVAWHRRSTPAYAPSPLRILYADLSCRLLLSSSTHILSNSTAALEGFHGTHWQASKKFQVIPNGVDSSRFRPNRTARARLRLELGVADDTLVIGHVGRVDPAKDHNTLLDAARMLRQRASGWRLVLVGPGTDHPDMRSRIADRGLTDITVTMGPRNDIQDWYNVFDVFAFPSVTEGQPNALIEAMLSGVRFVATNIPGIREAVPASQEEYLVPPRDPRALAQVIERRATEPVSVTDQVRLWAVDHFDLDRNLSLALQPLLAR